MAIDQVQFTPERWLQFWDSYKGLEHQKAAIKKLGQQIKQADPCLLSESSGWAQDFKAKKQVTLVKNPLPVKWQSQLDNKSMTGWRECFSSSCAMLAMYWLPGKIANDDAYNALRAKHGDSTSAQAQLATLRGLGLKADFRTDGNTDALEAEIDAGRPVAVGWLHHGPVGAPSGGGHWSVVIGYTAGASGAWIQNDPNGEALLIQGGYSPNTKGGGVVYSKKNWNPRWMAGGTGGWYLTCKP